MSGSLPPLAPQWAPYEEPFHDIARIVSLATGFVLIPVAVPGPDLARALGLWLQEGGQQVEAYELLGDAEWERLAAFLLTPTTASVVMVIGPATTPRLAAGSFGLVNQARDAIVKSLGRPLLWCGPRSFLNVTWQHAPDFWSIRSVDHSLYSIPEALAPAPVQATIAKSVTLPKAAPAAASPTAARSLLAEANAQRDPFSAAILAAREAEELLSKGRAEEALRLIDAQLEAGDVIPDEPRHRLAVLRARALRGLDRVAEANAELDSLLATPRLSDGEELEARLEKGRLLLMEGQVNGAEEELLRAQALAFRVGDASAEILARVGLGEAALLRGSDEARAILSKAAEDARALNDDRALQRARSALARALGRTHDSSAARQVAGTSLLDAGRVREVVDAAIKLGIDRGALLAGMDPGLLAALPPAASPIRQLLSDLSVLSSVDRPEGGAHPLEVWLRNAVLLAGERAEAAVFREALSALGAAPPHPPASAASRGTLPKATPSPLGTTAKSAGIRITVLHAAEDREYSAELRAHLTPLLRSGLIEWWSPDEIMAGADIQATIEEQVALADVLLVLVSADSLADDALMMRAHEHLQAGKTVVPILVRPCAWTTTSLGALRALPSNARPIATFANEDAAWAEIVSALRTLALSLR